MRTWVLVALAAVCLTGCPNKNKEQERLWGTWIGQGGVTMEFSASGRIHMLNPEGPTKDGTYIANFKTEPYELDIRTDAKPILTIFRFDSEGRLVVQSTEPGGIRPDEFDNGAVYFTRKPDR